MAFNWRNIMVSANGWRGFLFVSFKLCEDDMKYKNIRRLFVELTASITTGFALSVYVETCSPGMESETTAKRSAGAKDTEPSKQSKVSRSKAVKKR